MENQFDFDREKILKQSALKSVYFDFKKNKLVLEFADGEKTEVPTSSLIEDHSVNHGMVGENAYNLHDSSFVNVGIICGYTNDKSMYVIGYATDFGDIKELNLEKVYIDEECAKNCKTFKLSHPDDTIKFG